MRRAAVLGATAKVASSRGEAKGAAAAQAAPTAPVAAEPAAEQADAEAPVPSSAAGENYDTLIKLKGLLDAGVLSPEEFEAEKQKILGA
jgi:hypothetical protein